MLIQPYQENWPLNFLQIKEVLLGVLNGAGCVVEHVGSTAVPGLAAKPIIDIDVVYGRSTAFETIKQLLEMLGYTHNGNQGIAQREVFKRSVLATRHPVLDVITHHLYVCEQGSEELNRHLLFRNYLRKHPEARTTYQQLKYELAAAAKQDRKQYAVLKEEFARTFINKALKNAEEEKC